MSDIAPADVVAYYDEKTESILRKYGPGPRVHFHTGLTDGRVPEGADALQIRAALVAAQEALLAHLAGAWGARRWRGARVLDVGCGLGGSALYFAEEHGAHVTGVTIAPRHVELAARFARDAGVSDRVRVMVCDAHAVPDTEPFDAAYAIESSCYFDRPRFFERMRRVLGCNKTLHLVDCFLVDPKVREPFDSYWRTRIGTLREYDEAAKQAGFQKTGEESLNARTTPFWELSLSWIERSSRDRAPEVVARSREEHRRLRDAFANGAIGYVQRTYTVT